MPIMIRQFIQIAEKWLDKTNGEFIIENTKQFEIKTVSIMAKTNTGFST